MPAFKNKAMEARYKKAIARFLNTRTGKYYADEQARRDGVRCRETYAHGVEDGRKAEARALATVDNLQKQRHEEHARMREAFIRGIDASPQAITSHARILDAFMRFQERQ